MVRREHVRLRAVAHRRETVAAQICWHFMAPFTLAVLVGNPDVPV